VPEGLRATLSSATSAASKVRDRFSSDGWMALANLSTVAQQVSETVSAGDDAAQAMSVLLRKITGFAGLVHENMYHHEGWCFLSIGRSLERALSMTSVLSWFADENAPEGSLDL